MASRVSCDSAASDLMASDFFMCGDHAGMDLIILTLSKCIRYTFHFRDDAPSRSEDSRSVAAVSVRSRAALGAKMQGLHAAIAGMWY